LHRDVDELRGAGTQAAEMRDQRRDRAFRRGMVPRLRHGNAHRPAIGVAGQCHHAAHRRQGQIAGEMTRVRAVLAERCDGDIDELPVGGAEILEPAPARGHCSRRGILEHKVGVRGERVQRPSSRFAVEVDRDAAFAAVEGVEAQAGQTIR
jgi:hypothetical protein